MRAYHVLNKQEKLLLEQTGASTLVVNALIDYIEERRKVGHFLTAVLSNDLNDAFARADDTNVEAIGTLIRWIYNYAPSLCWGSKEKVERWLAREDGGAAQARDGRES